VNVNVHYCSMKAFRHNTGYGVVWCGVVWYGVVCYGENLERTARE